jgi:2-polyprenyl-6-methoxyphenol hydroxylase-like FAD-dependent oxidoreductase
MDCDVLISGAGPTGLMLANQLGRRGVSTMIIDRHSGPAQQSRALAVQARTLEIYSKLAIAERAVELGKIGTGANLWAKGEWKGRIPLGEIGQGRSPFPYVLILGQDDNELILGERLRDWQLAVQWNTELTALEQHADHVKATVRLPDGSTRVVTTAYLAGCDGAKSAVRELSKIPFPGEPYPHVFFVADTVASGPMRPDELNIYLWRDGFHLLFPMRGKDHWRVVGILPGELAHREGLKFDDVAPSIRREAGVALSFESCSWFSTYLIHHRCADRFQDRRCFLLGDAAHIHSPAGGQGMNTGLQDAYNLGWKLALVLQGKADASLAATYAEERRPVAQRLLETTDQAFVALVSDGWIARMMRTRILSLVAAYAMLLEPVQRLAFLTVSQIGIHYPASSLSRNLPGLPKNAPQAGDRFPWRKLRFDAHGEPEDLYQRLDDTLFNLLVIGQPAPAGIPDAGGLLRTHVVAAHPENDKALASANISGEGFYLLRPDGHIGLAGTRADPAAIASYLEHAGIARPAPG